MRSIIIVAFITLAACGKAEQPAAPAAPAAVSEPPIPGDNVTVRAANVRLALLELATDSGYDAAKFVKAADDYFATHQQGVAQLGGELKERNAKLAKLSQEEAKSAIFADGGKTLEVALQLELVLQMDHAAFLKHPDVQARLQRVGL